MNLPSLQQIGTQYLGTIRRFPLVILSAVVGSICAIALIDRNEPPQPSILYSILLASILALPLLTTLRLRAERSKLHFTKQWGLQALGVVLLIAYVFAVPTDLIGEPMIHMFRFAAFAVGLCLLFAVLPFWSRGEANGFWQFNRIVVFRIALTGAFAAVLFAGLALAMAALDNLFGINVPPQRYGQLWALINGLFSVAFFLSGIPDDLDTLDGVTDYPEWLRVFAQNVLAPLVLVYFVILYAYIAKIIFTWNWPQGWVGRLILGFSAAGILATFVLDPIRERIGQSWVKRAARWYYVVLLPLVVVLFLALWRRISEYGMTEDRYLGLAIGVWLAVVAVYFIFSKIRSIKIIPTSMCILTFVISFGPWGMFAVSEKSQISRLRGLLESNSILVNGSVHKAPGDVASEDVREISSILLYLREVHGYDGIQPWFAESLRADSMGIYRSKDAKTVAEMIGIKFNIYGKGGPVGAYSIAVSLRSPVATSGYDHIVRASLGGPAVDTTISNLQPACRVETTPDTIVLKIVRDPEATDSLVMDLRPLIDRATAGCGTSWGHEIPAEEATAEYESAGIRAKIIMLNMSVQRTDDTTKLTHYDALILYSHNAPKIVR